MSSLELMYTKSATFLRDVFQYLIPGVLFLGSVHLFVKLSGCGFLINAEDAFRSDRFLVSIFIFIIAYATGQALHSFSGALFQLYECRCFKKCCDKGGKIGKLVDYLKSIRGLGDEAKAERVLGYLKFTSVKTAIKALKKVKAYIENPEEKDEPIKEIEIIDEYLQPMEMPDKTKDISDDMHLFFEMEVFTHKPDLHARFVERYNVLMFFRRTLSSCFFVIFAIYSPPFIVGKCFSECSINNSGIMLFIGLLSLFLSFMFFKEYSRTELEFWKRIFTAYLIKPEKKKN